MKIELYPDFEEVFNNQELKGIFYPLCSIILDNDNQTKLFFISSNGLWNNDESSDNNNRFFTKFLLENKKYTFRGTLQTYQGYKSAQQIFPILEKDFIKNGKSYLKQKMKKEVYVKYQKENLDIEFDESFDIEYYLETFYEFSINKLNFQLNNQFGVFREVIDGWGKSKEESGIIYDCSESFKEIEVNMEYMFPKSIELSDYQKVGQILGSEFFTDGNDTILLFNSDNQMVLCVNSYS